MNNKTLLLVAILISGVITAMAQPAFTGGTTLVVCENAAATSINALLTVSDATSGGTGATETYSVSAVPSHGSIGGLPNSFTTSGGGVTPAGVTYTPTGSYSGIDAFTITVNNGTLSATHTVNVTVNATPSISVNPTDKTICAGASTTIFSVTAAGTGLTYQWWVSTNSGVSYTSLTNTGIYTGIATAILTLTQATAAANGNMYHCIVNGTCATPDTTTAATLTVTPPPVITGVTPMVAGPTATIAISGTGFNSTTTNNLVYFGSDMGTVNTASATSLNVSVPNGGTFDRITSINLGCKLMAYTQYPFLPDFTASSATPSFNPKTDNASGDNFPMDIVTADFDGDGKPDIAVTNGQGGDWSVFRNTSTSTAITYASPITFNEGPSGNRYGAWP